MALPLRRSRAAELADLIEARIIEGDLEPGERLGTREDLRAEHFVARATINEAIKLLQARSCVTVRPGPGGGLFAATPDPVVRLGRNLLTVRGDPSAITDAIEVREQLELLVAADAAKFRTPDDIAELRVLLEDMHSSVKLGNGLRQPNWRFHRRVAAITPNAVLRATYVALYDFITEVALVSASEREAEYVGKVLAVHDALLDAIESGNVAAARRAATRHRTIIVA